MKTNTLVNPESPETRSTGEIDNITGHEYAETIRRYLRLLTDDEVRVGEITGILINRSYNHFRQFFERNIDRINPQPAHTKSTRQSLVAEVAEIREKMPKTYLDGRSDQYNAALDQINLILTEIEGGE